MDVLRETPAFIVHSATDEPVRELDRAHVWVWDLDAVPQPDTARRFVLSANERARADRLRSLRLRRRFEARCLLVRHVLGPLVGVSPEALAFETTANGKPRLVLPGRAAAGGRGAALDFNLSHSENVLVLAVALDRQVGVDIEVVQPGVDVLAVAEAQFTAAELAWLRALPPEQQRPAFYRLWTRNEAISKVSGQGIASPPVATPSLATLHSFQFRLGETDLIGALALDFGVRRGATADRGRVDLPTGLRFMRSGRRGPGELGSAVGAAQQIFAKEG
jgi:4'-phosphopantetheinyl transferase